MALSKIVLFIVEGKTDELALGAPLTGIFKAVDGSQVRFGIVHGDITTMRDDGRSCSPAQIRIRVRDKALEYLSRYKLKWADLAAVVFVTDTDGAFIAASSVIQNDDCKEIAYFLDRIETAHADGIMNRNDVKSSCLRVLSRCGFLTYAKKRIPFKACYMSRNLEHALSGYSENASQEKKYELARKFSKRYRQNSVAFSSFLATIAPDGSYQNSWEFIGEGTHSLERYSNLSQIVGELTEHER